MSKTATSDGAELLSYLAHFSGDQLSFRQVFDLLGQLFPLTEGVIITSLPRGTLQIAQPVKVSELFLKGYGREFHAEDRPTWHVIATGKTTRLADAWPDDGAVNARFVTDFLRSAGFEYGAVAPLTAPIFAGYPGALHVYRTASQGDFSEEELDLLTDVARQLDEAIERARQSRQKNGAELPLSPKPALRQFVLNAQGRPILNDALEGLDERLRQQMAQHAQHRVQNLNGDATVVDRLLLPDSRGSLWTFRVVTHKHYPALGEGSFVIFSLQPDCHDWGQLRPADLQADSEIARLIPALRFMQDEFHRGPSLNEISRTVHLSPFHFHRRFTELLGITPKHFLLECQIYAAKEQLLAGEKELAEIAKDCGFAHQSHFTSRFKQVTGLTPTRWRKLASEQQKNSEN